MPRVKWISNGQNLDYTFLKWLRDTPTLIIPKFNDVLFPPVRFTDKKKLVTLNWDHTTFYYNINRVTFPNVEDVKIVGYTCVTNAASSNFWYQYGNYDDFYNVENQVQWKEQEWVNEEWLSSQFNQFFVKIQDFHQNELRKQLK